MEYKPLRQAFFAITCSYEIMNSVTIARVTVAIFAKKMLLRMRIQTI